METPTEKKKKREVPLKISIGFAVGEISDMIAYQGFSFLIFTFYFSLVKLPTETITLVFILWSIFNAFNDPILGAMSDRTKTKKFGGGRRRPWIIAMLIPLPAVMFFLFTPPLGNTTLSAIYFFIIICLFDTFYTAYSLNHTSLYPEMFTTDSQRETVGGARRILMVIGLIIAFILPGFVIKDLTFQNEDPVTFTEYKIMGIIFGFLILITLLIHLKFGIKEPSVDELEKKNTLSFWKSLTTTLKNAKFIVLAIASTMNWYVFGLLPMIIPIYATYVLDMDNSLLISSLLLIAFLSSIPGVLIWIKVDSKLGSKNTFIISTIVWIISFIPFIFITEYWMAAITMIVVGFGLGGAPFLLDLNISNIIDEDELQTNQRREASYYGIHALLIRLSTIMTILSVGFILNTNGWRVYDPDTVTPDLIFGLQSLMSFFPAGALLISLIFLGLFPLNKKRVEEIHKKKLELHNI
ncbi:MFS transporter [Promethearchaeum syntrophicum]|uniref:MFS transporter n=1 Tax=Promethearchaeum syntrophicum TaxID=2594042 RepID=A0A5B9DB20_9ARCH|nr:MFS transporter [Candidatus Prometheoarchaeum syntrophicum]QEE16191.1 putative symporter YagG [Candidatus Prometheoarchaeum syntrophicum]